METTMTIKTALFLILFSMPLAANSQFLVIGTPETYKEIAETVIERYKSNG